MIILDYIKYFVKALSAVSMVFLLWSCESGDSEELDEIVRVADLDIQSIEVEPADGIIEAGFSFQFSAIGIDSDGKQVNITSDVTWSSSETAISVNDSGRVSTSSGQDVTAVLSATLANVSGNTTLQSSTAAIAGLDVRVGSDAAAPMESLPCWNVQLQAYGTYVGEGAAREIIPLSSFVSWSVVTGGGEINSSTGYLRTRDDLDNLVRVTHPDMTHEETVTSVSGELTAVSISPVAETIDVDEKLDYRATGTYTTLGNVNITNNVTWETPDDDVSIAEFIKDDDPGEITGISAGSATVIGRCGETEALKDQTSLTVRE